MHLNISCRAIRRISPITNRVHITPPRNKKWYEMQGNFKKCRSFNEEALENFVFALYLIIVDNTIPREAKFHYLITIIDFNSKYGQ